MGINLKKELKEWLIALLIGFLVFLLIRSFVFSSYRIDGNSMNPVLHNNDKVLIWKLFDELDYADIVVFKANETDFYIKRVIGLPGDTVEVQEDQLFVNGKKINEPYLDPLKKKRLADQVLTEDFTLEEIASVDKIPEGKILVLGDNRLDSYDSRHYGLVSMDDIVGEVKFRFWPLNDMTNDFN